MLTDTKCRNAKSKDKLYKLRDEKGLYLEVKPSGAKTWRYRYEIVRGGERKESVFTIGTYSSAPSNGAADLLKAYRMKLQKMSIDQTASESRITELLALSDEELEKCCS